MGQAELLDLLAAAVTEASGAAPQWKSAPDGVDALLQSPGGARLMVLVRSRAYPRDVREQRDRIEQLQHAVRPRAGKSAKASKGADAGAAQVVIASPAISTQTRALLAGMGVGYVDGSGSVHVKRPGLLIHIDRPPARKAAREVDALHAGAYGQVVQALLVAHGEWTTGVRLSELSGTSPYTVSRVVNELERLLLLESKGSGTGRGVLRRLLKPDLVLAQWADAFPPRHEREMKGYLFAPDPAALRGLLADRLAAFPGVAVTGATAANQFAPWLTATDVIDLVVPPAQLDPVAQALQMKAVPSGHNLRLIARHVPPGLLHHMPEPGLPCVHPFMAYADTRHDARQRHPELAKHLLAQLHAQFQASRSQTLSQRGVA